MVEAVLWMLCKDICEYEQSYRQSNKDEREKSQKPSEPNNPPCGKLGKLGSCDKNLGLLCGNQKIHRASGFLFRNAHNFFAMPLNLILKLFGGHKSNGVVKQPIYVLAHLVFIETLRRRRV